MRRGRCPRTAQAWRPHAKAKSHRRQRGANGWPRLPSAESESPCPPRGPQPRARPRFGDTSRPRGAAQAPALQ